MEEVAGRGGRRKKVDGRGGHQKKVTGKGGHHEEGVWLVEPNLFRSRGRRIIYDLPSSRMEEVAGRGGRRKKVAGRGGRRKKVTGKGGRHEEGVWSVEPDLFRSGGRRWKKVEEESPEKVCWEDESPVETEAVRCILSERVRVGVHM
ncbi:hypothetical protein Tco_0654454 [Tanacetum coccineum]|uniref:Uncharacterized protein n=1 Tax=Tanacetum coccineum TaxID=301880 RepID=A0ABQ4X3D6_9ASTR